MEKPSKGDKLSPEMYRLLANIVAGIHLLVIIELIGGGILFATGFGQEHPNFKIFHATFVIVVIVSQIVFLGCPLVALENSLRNYYDPNATFYGSFTVYMVRKLFGVTIPVILVTVSTYLCLAIVIWGWISSYRMNK